VYDRAGRASPIATTVTHTWPLSRSSTVAPKMIFVSSVAAWRTTSAASFTSRRQVVAAAMRAGSPRADDLGVDQRRAERTLGRLAGRFSRASE
jgi:hypothetical protein